jgi:hypothetical protein
LSWKSVDARDSQFFSLSCPIVSLNSVGYAFSPRFPNNSILYVLDDDAEDDSKPAPAPTLPPDDVYVIGDKKEISTTFSSGNGGHGAMFDIECKSDTGDLVISSLDFHTDLVGVDINVKVFTKPGSYVGYGYLSDAWEIVADTTVKGEGYYKRTGKYLNALSQITFPRQEAANFSL